MCEYMWGRRVNESSVKWVLKSPEVKDSVVDLHKTALRIWIPAYMTYNMKFCLYCEESPKSNAFYLLLLFIGKFLGHPVLPWNRQKPILSTVVMWVKLCQFWSKRETGFQIVFQPAKPTPSPQPHPIPLNSPLVLHCSLDWKEVLPLKTHCLCFY